MASRERSVELLAEEAERKKKAAGEKEKKAERQVEEEKKAVERKKDCQQNLSVRGSDLARS